MAQERDTRGRGRVFRRLQDDRLHFTVQAVDGRDSRVGVSVTRAMGFPTPERFTRAWADSLLAKKLYGLIVARNGVNDNHTFFKSILHCRAQTQQIADYVREAYEALDVNDYGLNIKGDVLLVVTVCDNPSSTLLIGLKLWSCDVLIFSFI